MRPISLILLKRAALCLPAVLAAVLGASLATAQPARGQSAAFYQQGYPVETETATLPPDGTLPGETQPGFPTSEGIVTETASGPNLFLTENSQMNDSLTTPGASQTVLPTMTSTPTRTATVTPTPIPTITTTPVLPTPTPTREPLNFGPGPIDWRWTAAGAVLPFVLVSLGFMGITMVREARRGAAARAEPHTETGPGEDTGE